MGGWHLGVFVGRSVGISTLPVISRAIHWPSFPAIAMLAYGICFGWVVGILVCLLVGRLVYQRCPSFPAQFTARRFPRFQCCLMASVLDGWLAHDVLSAAFGVRAFTTSQICWTGGWHFGLFVCRLVGMSRLPLSRRFLIKLPYARWFALWHLCWMGGWHMTSR